jgi:epoxyqueuosine reductase
MSSLDKNTKLVKQVALDLGFQFCGISKTDFLEEEAPRLEKWLNENKHGDMTYMENHIDMRLDPRVLVPGSKSVVSLMLNYYPEQKQRSDSYQISKYAYGVDYHFIIKDKLFHFLEILRTEIGEIDGRVFVDSAPVMDKAWAAKSGLGWQGKNGMLIHPKNGSFFFLAELIIDLELIPDGPIKDYCGTCTKCIDACPTDALNTPYVVDGSKCISYLTIELKDAIIPSQFKNQMENWAFGCDICQDVCPWNRFSIAHNEPAFNPHPKLLDLSKGDWEEMTEELYREIFKKSPIKRTKFEGLKRNVEFLKKG